MPVTLRTHISEKYIRLSAAEPLHKARARVAGKLGIVFDEEKRPVTVVSAADLEKIESPEHTSLADLLPKLPPGILLAADSTMENFVKSPGITALDAGARGAMVYDKDKLVGILPRERIDRYIAEEFAPTGQTMGLAGSSVNLAGPIFVGPIILYCTDYKHRNELEYFDPDDPPECQVKKPKPHPVRR